ncbi:S-layer homology domain-containing protein [Sporomusa acidovorans]|uniref:SLH domain-containing protein n=1 Tax=Sporomusa acidovorans (strain ATCC 49682 / DSM 3132 / Mol) TaxID=1123286 RepID=A0ABZ3J8Z8_SPOA4|nr:S-layer homology domain-containing protein [Sporomusa acidovorans]OZC16654.1 outer membrane protein alpha precursor [Sporomusa acidovorans DSM 3132]SDE07205.1 S-layer homology domain-containing protein [Sporomusa acidovorans]
MMSKKGKVLLAMPLVALSLSFSGVLPVTSHVQAATVQSFSDVPAGHWAYAAVAKLAKAGLVDGYGDNSFQGDRTMSRYEFAFIVAKAMDKFEKADEDNKQVIDKLSAEFAAELNRLGARVAKVEAKTNTWVSGETRFRYMGNSPKAGGTSLRGSDRFDFRQRVKFQGTINDDVSWTARIIATGKAGNYNNNPDGSNAAFDMLAVTAKNVFGLDKVRIGRFPYDSYTYGLFSKALGVDGVRVDKSFGNVVFTGSVNNVKSNTNQGNGLGDSGDANTVTTAQLSGRAGSNLGWKAGYFWSEVPGTSTSTGTGSLNTNIGFFKQSQGWNAGFDAKLGDCLLIGEYVSTSLKGVENLPSSPKGWAVELTSATKQPPIFYGAKYLVDYKKKGDFGWSVSYRSIDAGVVPNGAGGFDAQAVSYATDPYSTVLKGTDNIKGFFVAFQNTISKNVVWTIEGQDLKIKNRELTGLSSNDLGKTYMTRLEFFY